MKTRRGLAKNMIAGCLVMAMIFEGMFAIPVQAQEEIVADNNMQSIISNAGNSEMKTYGEQVENGIIPTVTDADSPEGTGTSYYVDSKNGDNTNTGTSKTEAWKDFEPVNTKEFQPGDRILLKAGCEWSASTLHPLGSGTAAAPIILSSYGDGAMPKLSGNAQVEDVVYLYNQQHWNISNLDISNTAPELSGLTKIPVNNKNGSALSDVRGLHVTGQDGGQLKGFVIHNLYIHDVTGEDCWISGGTDDGSTPGITKGTGWDKSKKTGAVIFEILQPKAADAQPTTFHDITIENNVLIDNSFGSIIFKQWKGDKVDPLEPGYNVQWANGDDSLKKPAYESGNWNPHTNIVVQDNFLSHAGSEYACDTIYMTSVQGAVIQRNVSKEAGTSAIELYYADDVAIQYNEIYGVRAKAGGADSNAIDPDKKATNIIIQYNYTHETGDGILLCGFIYGTSVVRYNVVQDASKRYLNPHGDRGYNYIYNNIFYNTIESSTVTFVNSSGGSNYHSNTSNMHYFSNNIFYNAADKTANGVLAEGTGLSYSNNCYYGKGITGVSDDKNGLTVNPQFTGGSVNTIEDLNNFSLAETSPLINHGIDMDEKLADAGFVFNVATLGNTDLFGGNIYNDASDIGVSEFQGTQGYGTIHGYVYDEYGYKVSDATVTLNETTKVQSDKNGYYAFPSIKEGSYTIAVTMDGYGDSKIETVQVIGAKVVNQDLTLGKSQSTTGTITGIVKNASGGVAGATVKLSETMTTQTDNSGRFTFSDVPINLKDGYTLSAEKAGYIPVSKENILVRPATVTTLELVMSKDIGSTNYLLNENFDQYETGDFTGDEILNVYNTASANTIEIVEDSNAAENKYMQLTKAVSGSMNLHNSQALNLSGVVTIETRVKRTFDGDKANQVGMYSYNSADWKNADPATNPNPIATFAYSKGNIISHNVKGASNTVNIKPYTVGEWDIIRNVVNVDAGTYDFYVNDMTTPILANQPLRTQGKKLDYFNFFSNGTNTGDLCIDYFRVCVGAPYDYNDAALFDLSAKDVPLVSTGDTTYGATVDSKTTSIFLTPVIGFGSCTVNGVTYDGSNPVEVGLNDGSNTIFIVVTAEDGITTKEYTLEVEKENGDTLAYLKSLSIGGVLLSPEFNPDIQEYSADVDGSVDSISVNYEKVSKGCSIEATLNNKACDLSNLTLEEGDNIISIIVGSQDGTNYMNYVITVTKKAAEEPEHKNIAVSSQNGKLIGGTQGLATYSVTTQGIEDDTPILIDWCDSEGNPALAPTGITVTGSAISLGSSIVTIETDETALEGGYYFTVTCDDVKSDIVSVIITGLTEYYTVTFVDWDGTALKTETVEEGYGATSPPSPVRPGYHFIGWDKKFDHVMGDLIVTARYRKKAPSNPTPTPMPQSSLSPAIVVSPAEGIDLSIRLEALSINKELKTLLYGDEDTGIHGLVINLSQKKVLPSQDEEMLPPQPEGLLPSQTKIKIYVGNRSGFITGDYVYLYHYDREAEILEELPNSSMYQVDEDGYILVDFTYCSDYVILPKEANSKVILSLEEQIKVSPLKKTLYVGGTKGKTAKIQLTLPLTLKLVNSLNEKDKLDAVGDAVISYASLDKTAATVSKDGVITGTGKGATNIVVTIQLSNGKTITEKIPVKVQKAHIKITGKTNSMKLGKNYTFKAKAYGFNQEDIVWKTTKRSIVVINKKTGKAVAKSAGADYVVAQVGKVKQKIKITVK